MGRPPGRPHGIPLGMTPPASKLEDLVDNVNYFDVEMRDFLQRGEVYQLQRFLIALQNRHRALDLARIMAERVYVALVSGVPE